MPRLLPAGTVRAGSTASHRRQVSGNHTQAGDEPCNVDSPLAIPKLLSALMGVVFFSCFDLSFNNPEPPTERCSRHAKIQTPSSRRSEHRTSRKPSRAGG